MAGLVRDGTNFALRRGALSDPLLVNHASTLQPDASATSSGLRETAIEAKARRELREQRDQAVHSSQQRIKVVGAATSVGPLPTELTLQRSADNSLQLKQELGRQGTTAAKLTLSQLELQEQRHTKHQLQMLGLSTEGSAAVLKDRLKSAQAGSAGT